MRYFNQIMGLKTPFIADSGSDAGLIEKRLNAASYVGLSAQASFVAFWDRETDDEILLNSDVEHHKNNAKDPATDTLNISVSASSVWNFNRNITHNVVVSDHVHVAREGTEIAPTGYNLTANETINIGQPVYISSENTVNLADADTLNTSHVLGLASSDASANQSATVLSDGSVERSDWASVIGTANLTPGVVYYLSTTAGELTETPPAGSGDTVVSCGIAITTTKLDIEINEIASL